MNRYSEYSTAGSECNDAGKCLEIPSILCSDIKKCNKNDKIDVPKKCGPVFQCTDGELILATEFCDSHYDCHDASDETRNQPGFRCYQKSCVLPQRNLYDNISHCPDESDICFTYGSNSCFECYDKRHLISPRQVCDGIIDCYDLSDECICKTNLNQRICALVMKESRVESTITINNNNDLFDSELMTIIIQQNNAISLADLLKEVIEGELIRKPCLSKRGYIFPTRCDGRPECRDLSDECNCKNPPEFCQDPCRKFLDSFYLIGDRYCDGQIDTVWRFLNNSDCPQGFDEQSCRHRFRCKAKYDISIDESQLCDGIAHCDHHEDEVEGCNQISSANAVFASATDMIANVGFRCAFWIIGFLVIAGNGTALAIKVFHLKNSKLTESLFCQHLIVANISLADFLMGVYLLVIAMFSAIYSGYYGQVDHEWRTSISCSIIGSLAVISSEASCFLMVLLSAFRLYNIRYPVKSMTSSTFLWKMGIVMAWLFAFVLGIIPIPHYAISYFVHSVSFPSIFSKDGTLKIQDFFTFAQRYGSYKRTTFNKSSDDLNEAVNTLKRYFSANFPLKFFGYYGATSICMPRFFVAIGENAWEFTVILITVNFLCFAFIAVGYILIFFHTVKKSKQIRSNRSAKQESVLQRRIARLIATDFLCWIPICFMAYLRLAGVEFSDIVYQISAVFLLPINSALNPLLFSSIPEKICCFKKKSEKHAKASIH